MEQQQPITRYRVVDSAERGDKFGSLRTKLLEMGWYSQKLYSGDYWFHTHDFKKVGITRKTTQDFLGSLNQNFSQQLEGMLEVYDIRILLIENPWLWIPDTGQLLTTRGLERHIKKEVLNYIHRWQAKGFILERTIDLKDTVDRLNELYALYQKPYSLSAQSKGYADERILAFPPGCRGKTGAICLEKFGSLRMIAEANIPELTSLHGIGEQRAELIMKHFNRGTDQCGI